MSQEGLVSSNHYVVRIYPLILPPSALFPSLHPSRLFPSLCCRSTGRLTTLNILQPPFHRIMHHLCSLFSSTQSSVSSSFLNIYFLVSPAPLCISSVLLQLTSTGLSLKCSLGQTKSTLAFSFLSFSALSHKLWAVCVCIHTAHSVWVRMCGIYVQYCMCTLAYAGVH